ncbi:MAG: right-handed parallel beta-helix repeat-containing protein [Chitinophagaceae bacterium]
MILLRIIAFIHTGCSKGAFAILIFFSGITSVAFSQRNSTLAQGKHNFDLRKDFGAESGVHVDPAINNVAFQRAMERLYKNAGGTLFIPKGIYKISIPIRIHSNIHLKGSGVGRTIILLSNNAGCDVIQNFSFFEKDIKPRIDSFIVISGIEIDGNKSGNPRKMEGVSKRRGNSGVPFQAGIQLVNVRKVEIRNCFIHHCSWNGIVMGGASDVALLKTRSDDNGNNMIPLFTQTEAMGVLVWNAPYRGGSCRNIIIKNCSASKNQKHGIEVYGEQNENILIDSAFCTENEAAGIVINCFQKGKQRLDNGKITNSICYNNAISAVMVFGNGVTVSGCTLQDIYPDLTPALLNDTIKSITQSMIVGSGFNISISKNSIIGSFPERYKRLNNFEIRGITVEGDSIFIKNNKLLKIYGRGILASGSNIDIISNSLNDVGIGGSLSPIGIQISEGRIIQLRNNSIIKSGRVGIYVQNASQLLLSENTIMNAGKTGFEIYNSENATVSKNLIADNGKRENGHSIGLRIYNCREMRVSENICKNSSVEKNYVQDFGISIEGECSSINVFKNELHNNKLKGINISTASKTIKVFQD